MVIGHNLEINFLDKIKTRNLKSLIFQGPERIGKNFMANLFAQEISKEIFNINLESVSLGREIVKSSKISSDEGKTFIIEVSNNIKAQNTLLKQIEDGNKNIKSPTFIFIDHNNYIINTIKSRSTVINFKEIPSPLIEKEINDNLISKICMGKYSLAKLFKNNSKALSFRNKLKEIFEKNIISLKIYEVWEVLDQLFSENKIFEFENIKYSSIEIFKIVTQSILVDFIFKKQFFNLDLDDRIFKINFKDESLCFIYQNLNKYISDMYYLRSLFLRFKKAIQ